MPGWFRRAAARASRSHALAAAALARDRLDRHLALELLVPGQPDDAEAAGAEPALEPVAARAPRAAPSAPGRRLCRVRSAQRQGAGLLGRADLGAFHVRFRFRSATGSSCPAVILPPEPWQAPPGRQRGGTRCCPSSTNRTSRPAPVAGRPAGPSTDRQTLMVRRDDRARRRRDRPDPARAARPRLPRRRARSTRSRTTCATRPSCCASPSRRATRSSSCCRARAAPTRRPRSSNQLNGYRVESASSCVDRAEALDVPGDLEDAQRYLLEVLELRRDGLASIADALRVALGDQDRREGTRRRRQADAGLPRQRRRRHAALPPRPVRACSTTRTLSAPDLPEQRFLPDIEWLAARLRRRPGQRAAHRQRRRRRRRARACTATASPASPSAASRSRRAARHRCSSPSDLAFEVQVQNQGENTENDVTVSVTVGDGGDAIKLEETIDTIAAGRDQDGHDPARPSSRRRARTCRSRSRSSRVPGEQKTDNNKQQSYGHLHQVSRRVAWPRGRPDHHPGDRRPRRPRGVAAHRAALGDRARA